MFHSSNTTREEAAATNSIIQRTANLLVLFDKLSEIDNKEEALLSITNAIVEIKKVRTVDGVMPRPISKSLTFIQNRLNGIISGFEQNCVSIDEYKGFISDCITRLEDTGTKRPIEEVVQKKPEKKITTLAWEEGLKLFKDSKDKEEETVTKYSVSQDEFIDKKYTDKKELFPVSIDEVARIIYVDVLPMNTYYSKQMCLELDRAGIVTRGIDDYKVFLDQPILVINTKLWESKYGKIGIKEIGFFLQAVSEKFGKHYFIVSEKYRPNPKNGSMICFWVSSQFKQELLKRYIDWGFLVE